MSRESQETEDGFPREIADGVWWLGGCFPMGSGDGFGFDLGAHAELHQHVTSFLVVGAEKALMYDTGTPANWSGTLAGLDQILDGRPIDYLVPSHWEVPHAGNIEKLVKKFPDLQIYGDLRDYHLAYPQFADRLHLVGPGDELDLGDGYNFRFLSAPIKDLVTTVWGFESKTKVLFASDGMGYTHHVDEVEAALARGEEDLEVNVHLAGECSKLSGELEGAPQIDQILFLTQASLWWTRHAPIDPFFRALEQMMAEYSPRIVAPAHGNVISNIDEVFTRFERAYQRAYSEG
jgi:flavorubredoxin